MGEIMPKNTIPSVPTVPFAPEVKPEAKNVPTAAKAPEVKVETRMEEPAPIAPVNGPVSQEVSQAEKIKNQTGVEELSEFSKPGAILALMPGARATGEKLAKQSKVGIVIPLTKGEKAGVATEYVAINGYPFYIKKGVQVFVPQGVANLLLDLMGVEHADSKFGQSMHADRSQIKDGVEVADRLRG